MGIEEKKHLVFTYGTLKKGFPNHVLLEDLIKSSDAEYLGIYKSKNEYPLVCGPYKVPFLLNFPDSGNQIFGELYSVSKLGLDRMDELEGISNGHYERLPIQIVSAAAEDEEEESGSGGSIVEAVAYYGHRNYAEELWKRNGQKGFSKYSEEEAKGYIRRKDRPKNVTFIQHINLFISDSSSSDSN
ncbi:putative gamma-glutamylcyclotransferase At3g02910 [Papaver somniferum]|uniref:putative gamma-glutamylcyclotransferase At3g02910 n=1 Tax=Papaver somniferum TaxID=3469 RepID=UPI000E6F9EB0|nr:putative gamma-glutamylcyclotransferase At3g02910 [Papaver somniferum]